MKKLYINSNILNNIKKIISYKLLPISLGVLVASSITADNDKDLNHKKEKKSSEKDINIVTDIVSNINSKEQIKPVIKTSTISYSSDVDTVNDTYEKDKLTVNHFEYQMSDELYNKLDKLIKNHDGISGFYVESFDNKMSLAYNPDDTIFAASTIKAYYALYAYKEIVTKNISFDEKMTYLKKHYCAGSGIMQDNYSFGTNLTLDKIFELTLNISDNCAYSMLVDRFGTEGFNDFIKELGCKTNKITPVWANGNARDAVILWKEIYKFSFECNEGQKLLDILINAKYNDLKKNLPDYTTAHKSGWTQGRALNETGIVFGDSPYYIAIVIEGGPTNYNKEYMNNLIITINEVMKEYNNYKQQEKTLIY